MRIHPTMRRLGLTLAIAAIVVLSAAPKSRAQDSASSEYLIKAGFIYNFATLVQWPPASFPQPDSPIVIAILGEDHFGPTLDRVLEGKKVNGRPFAIRRIKSVFELQKLVANPEDCHILYVSSSEMAHTAEALQIVKDTPILTIGETSGFARSGGIINLVLEDNRVRFEVNIDAAKTSDLNISSRLLALARIVQSPAGNGRRAE
jgi:YfiR/HmsC-like